ncbi:MAG: Gfo/Idh/MocA family oxidoreductase [Xanthobacteraceae bacterium]
MAQIHPGGRKFLDNPGGIVIRLGIVGCNYGRTVLLPAFRTDARCEVVALAGTDAARAAQLAREAGVPKSFGDWRALVEDKTVDAVAIATPPRQQAAIAVRALELGKPVFAEKPMAATLASAEAMLKQACIARKPAVIDFEFPELLSWQRAKAMLDDGAIGTLRHVVVTWNVENATTRARLRSWKTQGDDGGGVLGNFVSHCFHYLEWFCGPIATLSARVFGLPGDPGFEATVALAFTFASGAGGSLTMSSASYLGSGHRIEFYGEDGSLFLINAGSDYTRGFELTAARRSTGKPERIEIIDPDEYKYADGRIAPVSRLARRFLDAIEEKDQASPGFAEGFRVQQLIDAARRSHNTRRLVETPVKESVT